MLEAQLKGQGSVELLRKRARPLTLLLIALVICFGSGFHARASTKKLRVLFIGNSLTYYNHLPSIVEALTEASGQNGFAFRMIAFPNFSLEDHWNQGEALRSIRQGGWDVVVLQQGPSVSAEGRQGLLEYARRFAEEIKRFGAKPALYMVWPFSGKSPNFDGVAESYRQAANAVQGLLFPVGEAWRAALKRDPQLGLYTNDGLHPTIAGSYLAALVIYEQLYGRSPVGLPSKLKVSPGDDIALPIEQTRLMQEAAAEANKTGAR